MPASSSGEARAEDRVGGKDSLEDDLWDQVNGVIVADVVGAKRTSVFYELTQKDQALPLDRNTSKSAICRALY